MKFDRDYRPHDKKDIFPFYRGECDLCHCSISRGNIVYKIHDDIFDDPRLYLNCPFKDKDHARKLGARWDRERSKWYVDQWTDASVQDFDQWLPSPTDSLTTWYPSYYHEKCAEGASEKAKSLLQKAFFKTRKREVDDIASSMPTKMRRIMTRRKLSDFEKKSLRLRLRKKRGLLSKLHGQKEYMIFPNDALEDLLQKVPMTHEELLNVKGIKQYRSEMYSDCILSTIRDFLELDYSEMTVGASVKVEAYVSQPVVSRNTLMLSEDKKDKLRDALMSLRRYLADLHGTCLFKVFTNDILEDLIEKLPSSRSELVEIKGIKSFRADMYGELILEAINSFLENIENEKSKEENGTRDQIEHNDFSPTEIYSSSARLVSPIKVYSSSPVPR